MSLPKTSFLARLTRDVETRFTDAGMCISKVGLACSEKYGEKETQFFITGTAFKKTGEMIANITKGQRVFVTGKLQTDKWTDNNTGQNRSAISMVIESFEFIEPRDNQQQQGNFQQPQNQGFQTPQNQQFQQGQRDMQNPGGGGFQSQPRNQEQDQDLPF